MRGTKGLPGGPLPAMLEGGSPAEGDKPTIRPPHSLANTHARNGCSTSSPWTGGLVDFSSGLEWPESVGWLAHVAVCFYGRAPDGRGTAVARRHLVNGRDELRFPRSGSAGVLACPPPLGGGVGAGARGRVEGWKPCRTVYIRAVFPILAVCQRAQHRTAEVYRRP